MIFLSIVVGILAGLGAVILKKLVHLIQSFLKNLFVSDGGNFLYIFYPVIGIFFVVLFARYIIRQRVEHGIPTVLFAISKRKGVIRKHNMFSFIVSSAITVGFGGSVGLEGPTVVTGAAIGSNLGRMFHLNYKQIVLLLGCACTGAIAAIFKAPVAAIIFALEVIMLDLAMSSLVPLLLASASAVVTSYLFMGQNVLYPVEIIDTFHIGDIPLFILLGVFAGLVSVYFTKVYMYTNALFGKIKSCWTKLAIGGISLGFLIFLMPSLYGEGYEVINEALGGDISYLFNNTFYSGLSTSFLAMVIIFVMVLLFKVIATSLTFNAGGVGGIFAPSLFLGANLGLLFGLVATKLGYEVSLTNFALVGMAGTIAGIIHAPLMSIFLIAEITGGYALFLPLIIVSAISYATVKLFTPNSVYTIQLAKRGELMTHHKDRALLSMLSVTALVETNFYKVYEEGTLRDVVDIISKSNRNIFPVLDEENVLKGIVVLDDIRDLIFKPEMYDKLTVREIMISPKPYLINIDDNMESVAEKFQLTGNYNLPVVDHGKYVGFISRARVFSHYRRILKNISED
jgi:CIC family chloride channel protein